MDKLKLKWKIFAFLLGFCSLLLIILWLMQTVFLYDMYKYIRRGEMQKAMDTVAQSIDSGELSQIFTALEAEKEILVTPTKDFAVPTKPPREDVPKHQKQEVLTQKCDYVLKDGSELSLTFYAIITPVDATVSTLQAQLYIITAVMLLSSIILALVLAGHIAKPIAEINSGTKRLATGDYNTVFDGHGFLEISELSHTLNTTAQKLGQVEGLRRELMANVSHDLRTPLALIYSYTEMMHDFPQEITPEQTQLIMDETKRLTSLVNDVLDVSRLEGGTMQLNSARYNLTSSIAKTIARTAELVKRDGFEIAFEQSAEAFVNADEVKITQAFYNLLVNAVNYSGKSKNIKVRQSITDGIVTIEVIDNGEGIAPDELQNIWQRYYRGSAGHKRPSLGSGLGLAVVKQIIDLHGGTCGANSIIGESSNFWFSLKTDK